MPPLRILRRNIRLASSWSVIFGVYINPLLALAFLVLVIRGWFKNLIPYDSYRFQLAVIYLIGSCTMIPLGATLLEEERLSALGWTVRTTRLGEIDRFSWVLLCFGGTWFIINFNGGLEN